MKDSEVFEDFEDKFFAHIKAEINKSKSRQNDKVNVPPDQVPTAEPKQKRKGQDLVKIASPFEISKGRLKVPRQSELNAFKNVNIDVGMFDQPGTEFSLIMQKTLTSPPLISHLNRTQSDMLGPPGSSRNDNYQSSRRCPSASRNPSPMLRSLTSNTQHQGAEPNPESKPNLSRKMSGRASVQN